MDKKSDGQMKITRSDERGKTDIHWLTSRHSFSFNHYFDANKLGFGKLVVLNDDIIEPGYGFEPHGHKNMEIVTIILDGKLKHKDNSGGEAIMDKNYAQAMTAGKGIIHSEKNPSTKEKTKLLQLWIKTKQKDLKPGHGVKKIIETPNKLCLIASGNSNDKALKINQDAYVSTIVLEPKKEIMYEMKKETNGIYLFVIEGKVDFEDEELETRDAAEISGQKKLSIKALKKSRILIIEVPM